jgi:S-DNA-T family DNA segregation ATPase FtsK/SpoIIIE
MSSTIEDLESEIQDEDFYSDRGDVYERAKDIILQEGKATASLIQRRLSIGYARAARILDQLENDGYIGSAEGSKPRAVLKERDS